MAMYHCPRCGEDALANPQASMCYDCWAGILKVQASALFYRPAQKPVQAATTPEPPVDGIAKHWAGDAVVVRAADLSEADKIRVHGMGVSW